MVPRNSRTGEEGGASRASRGSPASQVFDELLEFRLSSRQAVPGRALDHVRR
jgi:hypothetical protein